MYKSAFQWLRRGWPRAATSHASIARRLGFGFTAVIALLLTVAVVDALAARDMARRFGRLVEVNNRKVDLAYQLQNRINQLAVQTRSISLLADPQDVLREMRALEEAQAAYTKVELDLAQLLRDPATARQETRLFAEIREAAAQTLPFIRRAAKEGQEGANMEASMTLMREVRPREAAWQAKVNELVAIEQELNRASYQEAKLGQARATNMAAALAAAAIALGSLLGWRIVRGVREPIEQAICVAERIATGDLSARVPPGTHDEVGRMLRALATMQARLRALVEQIHISVDSIRGASADVASGNTDLSRRTETAAASLQETASSVGQLADNVRANAEAAATANRLATDAAAVAQRGGQAVDAVVATMDAIGSSSRKITEITGVIDAIAFQTNILALNAAVEAARAGEQGRGFSVVAAEVRALAKRSADAAKEIKELIATSSANVNDGARLVVVAGETMSHVVASVGTVSGIIGEISAASQEQACGVEQINDAISRLDNMTQQNSALVEESSAAAESLRSQAQLLGELVATFRLEPALEPRPDEGPDAAPSATGTAMDATTSLHGI